jgi:hypothetical protein
MPQQADQILLKTEDLLFDFAPLSHRCVSAMPRVRAQCLIRRTSCGSLASSCAYAASSAVLCRASRPLHVTATRTCAQRRQMRSLHSEVTATRPRGPARNSGGGAWGSFGRCLPWHPSLGCAAVRAPWPAAPQASTHQRPSRAAPSSTRKPVPTPTCSPGTVILTTGFRARGDATTACMGASRAASRAAAVPPSPAASAPASPSPGPAAATGGSPGAAATAGGEGAPGEVSGSDAVRAAGLLATADDSSARPGPSSSASSPESPSPAAGPPPASASPPRAPAPGAPAAVALRRAQHWALTQNALQHSLYGVSRHSSGVYSPAGTAVTAPPLAMAASSATKADRVAWSSHAG